MNRRKPSALALLLLPVRRHERGGAGPRRSRNVAGHRRQRHRDRSGDSIVVRGGRIASCRRGRRRGRAGPARRSTRSGMTALPGFIDAPSPREHGPQREGADAGAARRRLHDHPVRRRPGRRQHHAPRSHRDGRRSTGRGSFRPGACDLANGTPDAIRAEVRTLAALGVKFIGEIGADTQAGPDREGDWRTCGRAVDEAKKAGVWVQIHAVSPQAMMAAVDAGVPKLVHTPHFGWLSFEDAKRRRGGGREAAVDDRIRRAGVRRVRRTTTSRGSATASRGRSRFVDGDGRGRGSRLQGRERAHVVGRGRRSTATAPTRATTPKAGLAHELQVAQPDVLDAGHHQADGAEHGVVHRDERSSSARSKPGKLADIVLVDGNPLDGYWNLLEHEARDQGRRHRLRPAVTRPSVRPESFVARLRFLRVTGHEGKRSARLTASRKCGC